MIPPFEASRGRVPANTKTLITEILAGFLFFLSVSYSLASLFSYAFTAGALPAFLRIPRRSPVFMDLRQLTYSSGCGATFQDLVQNIANCDPKQRPFNYTASSLSTLRFFGIDAGSTEWLGAAMGLLAIAATLVFIFTMVKGRAWKLMLSSAVLLSFPFQLALERGNHDSIVLGLCLLIPVCLACPWLQRSALAKALLSSPLAFTAVAWKVFPALGLIPWAIGLLLKPTRIAPKPVGLLLLLSACVAIVMQLSDLAPIMANTPKPDGWLSFGWLASYQSRLGSPDVITLSLGKLVLLLLGAKAFLGQRFDWLFPAHPQHPQAEAARQAAILFTFMLLGTWFLNRSWDYRMIITLGLMPYFLNACTADATAPIRRKIALCAGVLFPLYEQYYYSGSMAVFVSDVLIQPLLMGLVVAFLLRSFVSDRIAPAPLCSAGPAAAGPGEGPTDLPRASG